MPASYTYDPTNIREFGKDRMRFELGDTMTDGKEETCALCDEEYIVLTEKATSLKMWKKAKLKCLESICRRFAYEPDTKVGPLTLGFNERAKLWREEYEKLKKDIKKESISASAISMNLGYAEGTAREPYFYTGMMSTEESEGGNI